MALNFHGLCSLHHLERDVNYLHRPRLLQLSVSVSSLNYEVQAQAITISASFLTIVYNNMRLSLAQSRCHGFHSQVFIAQKFSTKQIWEDIWREELKTCTKSPNSPHFKPNAGSNIIIPSYQAPVYKWADSAKA